jgi:hypothetical protein
VGNRVTHYAFGAATVAWGSLAFSVSVVPPYTTAIAAVVGAVTAGGRCSPDMDQTRWWGRLDRRLPDELFPFGGPMRHRGITHWWGVPAPPTVLMWWQWPVIPAPLLLIPFALVAGWWSHLVLDFILGARYRGGRRPERDKTFLDSDDHPRGPGIPLLPWWGHVGLGFRNGSLAEVLCMAFSVFALWAAVGAPGAAVVAGLGHWASTRS